MATRESISITFSQAIGQADSLDGNARELRNLANRLTTHMNELRTGWTGPASDAYIAKCEALKAKITQSASDLEGIAGAIRQSAQQYRTTELRLLEIAETRMYGTSS